ncbi:MAG: 30S ribosome-binding factor RbfA [Gemmatimonadetes bacterium]|nr:30S ribosome-binding factor RbfA [Gemmatimonadota bacterium]
MAPRGDPRRPDRVAAAVREEIATILAEGVRDPRVTGFVTVTGVEMTRDLAVATVFVSIYADEPARSETLEGLRTVAPTFRGRIGQALRLRLAPEIVFRLDESIARAARIESLLSSVRTPSPEPNSEIQADDDHGER